MRKNYFLGNDITIGTIKYVKRSKVMIRLDRNAVIAQDSNLFAFVVKRRKNRRSRPTDKWVDVIMHSIGVPQPMGDPVRVDVTQL